MLFEAANFSRLTRAALGKATDLAYLIEDGPYQTNPPTGPSSFVPANGGIFDTPDCKYTAATIQSALDKLSAARAPYTHHKLVAGMGFGFWRYLFARHQFAVGHQILLQVFPAKPVSTVAVKYNQKLFFKQLAAINGVRNRMAHHEPICFRTGSATVDTGHVRRRYDLLQQLFQWMAIDEEGLLFGLDHILAVCDKIDRL